MKKGILGVCAIIVAVLLVSFTSNVTNNESTELYWFPATNNQLSPILASEPTHPDDPFGCPDEGTFVCTKAYLPSDTEQYVDGSTVKRRVKNVIPAPTPQVTLFKTSQ